MRSTEPTLRVVGTRTLPPRLDHPLGEIEARPPEIEAAVDMRGLDVDEAPRADRLGEAHEEPHRERRARAMRAGDKLAIERGEFEGHWGLRYRRGGGGSTCGAGGSVLGLAGGRSER